MEKRTFGNKNQILADVSNYKSLSVVVGDAGVTAGADGKKVILAGTPIGGADPFAAEQAVLTSTNTAGNGATAHGVALHDIHFNGKNKANGTLLYFGTVNEFRFPNVTVVAEAKTALDGKVYFVKRNK
ncbi:hypothetical protein [uncultured Vagococcus sp.]|uniref:hypothetical protein n=1 Tax=uncultured Vagococcus sp. TaxID=189676 RepID=UPI0028D422A5|nr:hypothetical protein [uncultured Vagococcus sp.]